MENKCMHYTDGKCKNGFPVSGSCAGAGGTPFCLNEELPPSIIDPETGHTYLIKKVLEKRMGF